MAKVSYDHSGSYHRESKSSTRSYTNRDLDDEHVEIDFADGYRKYKEYNDRPRSNEFVERTSLKDFADSSARYKEFDEGAKVGEFDDRAARYKEEYNERAKYKDELSDRADKYKEFDGRAKYNEFEEIALQDRSFSREHRYEHKRRESGGSYRKEEGRYQRSMRKQESFNSGRENVRLIQPGRSDRPSVETESVLTDSSRIPMGLEVLQYVDKFVIRQSIESEAWWDVSNFIVENGRGRHILEIKQEKADNACLQAFLGKTRHHYMQVSAGREFKEVIMELEHPFSCLSPMFCPWSSPSFIVRMATGEKLGQVRSAPRETCSTCLPPTKYFEVASHDGTIINAVTGPTCYPFECKDEDKASFQMLKIEANGNSSHVGEIDHEYRGCCGGMFSCCVTDEQEAVSITFPKDSPVEEKALYLGLGLLAFFTFFEVN